MTTIRQARQLLQTCDHEPGDECWNRAKADLDQQCAVCGSTDNIEADHVIPLQMGGAHCGLNVQPLCRRCNRWKGKSIYPDFMMRIDLLNKATDRHLLDCDQHWANGELDELEDSLMKAASLLILKGRTLLALAQSEGLDTAPMPLSEPIQLDRIGGRNVRRPPD